MKKHLSDYTRNEIISCLHWAGHFFDDEETMDTEALRNHLNVFIADGCAPDIEETISETSDEQKPSAE